MELDISGRRTITDVTYKIVEEALRSLPDGTESNEFVVLTANKTPYKFIQTRTDGPRSFIVMLIDHSVPVAFQLARVTRDIVLDLFSAYFRGDHVALGRVKWQDVTSIYLQQSAAPPSQRPAIMEQDLTKLIERLELFEERLGVNLEGLYAKWEGRIGYVTVNGELHPRDGLTLRENIVVRVTAYDDTGRVLATGVKYFLKDKFYGFETFSELMNVAKMPAKIRVYPKAM